jgi:hypothetical protein
MIFVGIVTGSLPERFGCRLIGVGINNAYIIPL